MPPPRAFLVTGWLAHCYRVTITRNVAIQSFGDAATEDLYHGRPTGRVKRIPPDIRSRANQKLDLLNAAARLDDLRIPSGNNLEPLKGKLKGFHSIRVNDQWRVVFKWTPAGPATVGLVDYHS